jgi:lipocalin-like protein
MSAARLLLLALALAMAIAHPVAAQQPADGDRQKFVGIWRLVSITADGKVNPVRGGKPTGYIFYTASGEMGAMIQPDRPPITTAGREASPQEAHAALKGYTAYFGTYTVDEKAKIVTHHRTASVQPGFEADVRRNYRFEAGDRLVLGGVGTTNQIVWVRVK